jgi:hypothetical protein
MDEFLKELTEFFQINGIFEGSAGEKQKKFFG